MTTSQRTQRFAPCALSVISAYTLFYMFYQHAVYVQSNLPLQPPENCAHLPIMDRFAKSLRNLQLLSVRRKPRKCIHMRNAGLSEVLIHRPKRLLHALPAVPECGFRATCENSPRINEETSVVHLSHIQGFALP